MDLNMKFIIDLSDHESMESLRIIYDSLDGDEKIKFLLNNKLDIRKCIDLNFDQLPDSDKSKLYSYTKTYNVTKLINGKSMITSRVNSDESLVTQKLVDEYKLIQSRIDKLKSKI